MALELCRLSPTMFSHLPPSSLNQHLEKAGFDYPALFSATHVSETVFRKTPFREAFHCNQTHSFQQTNALNIPERIFSSSDLLVQPLLSTLPTRKCTSIGVTARGEISRICICHLSPLTCRTCALAGTHAHPSPSSSFSSHHSFQKVLCRGHISAPRSSM